MEQSAKKDEQIISLKGELVKCVLHISTFFTFTIQFSPVTTTNIVFIVYCCYFKDKTSKSFESMKSDIKMCDVRVLELTAELSRQTEEAKKFKVIQISEVKGC